LYSLCDGVIANKPCERFSIRLDKRGSKDKLMIGFAPKAHFDVRRQNHKLCGWYLNVENGTLWCEGEEMTVLWCMDSMRNTLHCAKSPTVWPNGLPNGSQVTAIFNSKKQEIQFEIEEGNGEKRYSLPLRRVFYNELYPALEIQDENVQITLVSG
jgi:hypothetical protein